MIAPGEFHSHPNASPIRSVSTVQETRHANLLALIEQHGSIQQLAARVGRSHSQISQLKNRVRHSKSGRPREVGDDLARAFEAALGLPRGWMDRAPPRPEPPAAVMVAEESPTYGWPFRRVSPAAFASLSAEDRARVEGFIESLVLAHNERHPTDGSAAAA